jgi:hypothetical protein
MPSLTPDQYAQLLAQFQAGNYNLNSSGFAPTGVVHSGEDAGNPSQLLGFGGNFSGLNPGSRYDLYGANGDYSGQRQVDNGGSAADLLKSTISDNAEGVALLAALYGAGSLVNGGFLGFGGGAGEAGAGAGGTDIFGGNGMATGFTDTGTAGGALDTAYAGSGALTGANGLVSPELASTAATTGLTNAVKSAIPSGVSSLLGPAATLLGAAAGSQGQNKSQTSQQDIPEWLKPYVTGQGGLLQGAQSLFQQQTAPGALPGYGQMQQVGMGLLSQPIAGNGYQQFANMPRFGTPR